MVLLVAAAWAARPEAAGFVDDAAEPIRCHWLEGQASLCDVVLPALEAAWAAQVGRLGFATPLPDGGLGGSDALDVYLTHDETGGAGGAYVACDGEDTAPCVDAAPDDGRQSTPSYIVIDPDTPVGDLPRFAEHEFNHVLQYATAFEEPFLDVWEGTAVAAESWTNPDFPLDPGPIADYQATPWASALLQDGYWLDDTFGLWSYYEYGATVWVRWLDARHGDGAGAVGPALWAAMANDPGPNEPDVLDAWGTVAGGDWRGEVPDFVRMRATLGTAAQPAWAAGLDDGAAVAFDPEVTLAAGETATWTPENPLWPLGAAYLEVHAATAVRAELTDAGDAQLVDLDAPDGTPGALALTGGKTLRLAVVRVPDSSFDADDPLTAASPGLTLSAEAGPAEGCGCASGAGGGARGAAVLLGIVGAGWRRRGGAIGRRRPGPASPGATTVPVPGRR